MCDLSDIGEKVSVHGGGLQGLAEDSPVVSPSLPVLDQRQVESR